MLPLLILVMYMPVRPVDIYRMIAEWLCLSCMQKLKLKCITKWFGHHNHSLCYNTNFPKSGGWPLSCLL